MPSHLRAAAAAVLAAATVAAVPASAAHPGSKPAVFAGAASPALGINHVFVIVLENKTFDELYGTGGSSYLSTQLEPQGTLLPSYYGIGHLSNPNYLALISGQGPNPQTQADCQSYDDFVPSPAVIEPLDGQAIGQGCIYPANVPTIADQLDAKGLSWGGYMEDMGNQLGREPSNCGEPAFMSTSSGPRDATQSATATDQYAARHNPFIYFHSIVDRGACHSNVVPLGSPDPASPDALLSTDLQSYDTTPNYTFITPDLCHDGHDEVCADPREPGGIAGIDEFLRTWVPLIQASPAYQQDGLIVITTDESEWNQSEQDSAACCGEGPGPDSPLPGITGFGGGKIGTLLLGTCIAAGATDSNDYNHYSLLRTVEDLFGVDHLGYAGTTPSFGPDVFSSCPRPVAALAKKG